MKPLLTRMLARLESIYGLDYRSLGLFRFVFGSVILWDILSRWGDLEAFYTDTGMMPRWDYFTHWGNPFLYSLNLAHGSIQFQAVLFFIALIVAFCFTIGFRTKLATVLTWIMMYSIQVRTPVILLGGDSLMLITLLCSLFLPLGASFSVDKAMNSDLEPLPGKRVFNFGTLLLLVQLTLMYVYAGVYKTDPIWTDKELAVHYIMNIHEFSTPLGVYIAQFPDLTQFLTRSTLILEIYGMALFWTPFLNGPLRTIGVLMFVGLHVGFILCMFLGIFPWVDLAVLLPFLPTFFWDRLGAALKLERRQALTLYFDGECGFCKKMVFLLKTFLILPEETRILLAQSEPAIAEAMERQNSWVVVDAAGQQYYQFEAYLKVLETSALFGWKAKLLRLPLFAKMGQACYQWVAKFRYAISVPFRPLQFRPQIYRPFGPKSILANAVALFLIVFLVRWNVDGFEDKPYWLSDFGYFMKLDQKWVMFYHPSTVDNWLNITGTLNKDPKHPVNALTLMFTGEEKEPWKAKPPPGSLIYPNIRWVKYLYWLPYAGNVNYDSNLLSHVICNHVNAGKTKEDPNWMEDLEIYNNLYQIPLPGEQMKILKTDRLFAAKCSYYNLTAPPAEAVKPKTEEKEDSSVPENPFSTD